MNFVYLCRDGENEELRYSLRSLYKFYPDANVWLVGGKPDWYTGRYIKVPQMGRNKFDIVLNNIKSLIASDDIPEDIVMMNDDFFFVKHVEQFVPLAGGSIRNKILEYRKNRIASSYLGQLASLMSSLKPITSMPIDFELHVPIQIKKSLLAKMMNDGINTMWRSNYGNRFIKQADLTYIKDVKFYGTQKMSFKDYNPITGDSPFFSTDDKSFVIMKDLLLGEMFPDPSPYEV